MLINVGEENGACNDLFANNIHWCLLTLQGCAMRKAVAHTAAFLPTRLIGSEIISGTTKNPTLKQRFEPKQLSIW
jgi:hypothetical protein